MQAERGGGIELISIGAALFPPTLIYDNTQSADDRLARLEGMIEELKSRK